LGGHCHRQRQRRIDRAAAEYLQVPAGLVEAAVAHYGEYWDEIDQEIELNEADCERGLAAAAAGKQALGA
jgi:hypothetical protein